MFKMVLIGDNMIKDKLKNAKTYYNLSENLKKGFLWLGLFDFNQQG